MKKYRVMFTYEAGGVVTVVAEDKKDAEAKVYAVINNDDPEALRNIDGMTDYEVTYREFTTDYETQLLKP